MKSMENGINIKLTPIGIEYQQIMLFRLLALVDIDKMFIQPLRGW
jgi:hypothetical protein